MQSRLRIFPAKGFSPQRRSQIYGPRFTAPRKLFSRAPSPTVNVTTNAADEVSGLEWSCKLLAVAVMPARCSQRFYGRVLEKRMLAEALNRAPTGIIVS